MEHTSGSQQPKELCFKTGMLLCTIYGNPVQQHGATTTYGSYFMYIKGMILQRQAKDHHGNVSKDGLANLLTVSKIVYNISPCWAAKGVTIGEGLALSKSNPV